MSEEHSSTLTAEEVLAQAISPEKKQELIQRLTKLKSTLNNIENQMESQQGQKTLAIEELSRRLEILEKISYDTRGNINSILQVQMGEKYHPALQPMLKNLEKANIAYGLILDSLIK